MWKLLYLKAMVARGSNCRFVLLREKLDVVDGMYTGNRVSYRKSSTCSPLYKYRIPTLESSTLHSWGSE